MKKQVKSCKKNEVRPVDWDQSSRYVLLGMTEQLVVHFALILSQIVILMMMENLQYIVMVVFAVEVLL